MKRLVMAFFAVLFVVGSMVSESSAAVTITADQLPAIKFSSRHTVTGITTPLPVAPDVPGYTGAAFLTVGDIDQDGVKEIICTSGIGLSGDWMNFDGAIAIFTWDGSNLDNWTQSVINSSFVFPNETVLRDMDGDGDLDIMVMDNFIIAWLSCGSGGIYWLENLGGDITNSANWVKQTIYVETDDGGSCPCSGGGSGTCNSKLTSYHRARFLDLNNDGLEDFVTTKVHMWYWTWTTQQYTWMEWFKNEGSGVYSGPHLIGDGGGFLFEMFDVDKDDDQDVVAGQFFIYDAGFVPKAPGDPHGDSIVWFENPGKAALETNPDLLWTRRTIDNQHTSPNPVGKIDDIIVADIDNDGVDELVLTNHHHQQYSSWSGSPLRYWPAGVYYLEVPADPKNTSQWDTIISIETGDPNLDPDDHEAVLNDVYGVDRSFTDYTGQGSPGLPKAEDINGDGFPELLIPGDGKGALYYYQNTGAADSFKRSTLYKDIACMPGEALFEDIDGDGYTDIVAAIYDTGVTKNVGGAPFSSSIFVFRQDRDVDGDGICNPGDTDTGCTGSDNCPYDANPGQEDTTTDGDGAGDACDKCPTMPDGPNLGTCVKTQGGMVVSYRTGDPKDYITCTSDADCTSTGGTCQLEPGDCNDNGVGDVCECYTNFTSPEDIKVNLSDLGVLKGEYGRNDCSELNPCSADANGDSKVNLQDLGLLKNEYGRQDCSN